MFIVGPTATGKTDVAAALAQDLKAEIVSCDAMQVYKELSLLTAKPSPGVLKTARHHLVGIVSVKENWDVVSFRKKALRAIAAIERKNKLPLVVGGSGLYMAILLDGIFEEKDKGRSLAVRARIKSEAERLGPEALHERLKNVDPVSAAGIHAHDARRIIRALEVFETHGTPISALKEKRQGLWDSHDVKIFALSMDRSELYARINARVDRIFEQGVEKEVKAIAKTKIGQTASGVIGLKEIQMRLEGKLALESARELIKRHTRRYAKRQLTWFRKDKRIHWITISPGEGPSSVAKRILKQIGAEHV